MASLAELPELAGFFSYSREDDEAFKGQLSALRDAIYRELGAQLGRGRRDFRLWQDKEAIAPGKLWESEINGAVAQAAFFVPIVTPRSVGSKYCKFEFTTFFAGEKALGRSDVIFPILYIAVPALDDEANWRDDPVLSVIGRRQYVDWRPYRHLSVDSAEVSQAVERFCEKIAAALRTPWVSPEERRRREDIAQVERLRAQDEARSRQRAEDDQRRAQQAAGAEQPRRVANENVAPPRPPAPEVASSPPPPVAAKNILSRRVWIGGGLGACTLAAAAALVNRAPAPSRSGSAEGPRDRAFLRSFAGHTDVINSVAITPDGRVGLLASRDKTLRSWDLGSGAAIRTFSGHTDAVTSVVVTPDGRTALSGSEDDTIKIWKLETGDLIATIRAKADGVFSLALTPDGNSVLAGCRDGDLRLWSLDNGAPIRTFAARDVGAFNVRSVAITANGRAALAGHNEGTLELWDLASGALIKTFVAKDAGSDFESAAITSVVATPDGKTALAARSSTKGRLELWDVASGALDRAFGQSDQSIFDITSVAVTPDGRKALSGARPIGDGMLELWDLASGKLARGFTSDGMGGTAGDVMALAIAPDGRTALAGHLDKVLRLWDLTVV